MISPSTECKEALALLPNPSDATPKTTNNAKLHLFSAWLRCSGPWTGSCLPCFDVAESLTDFELQRLMSRALRMETSDTKMETAAPAKYQQKDRQTSKCRRARKEPLAGC